MFLFTPNPSPPPDTPLGITEIGAGEYRCLLTGRCHSRAHGQDVVAPQGQGRQELGRLLPGRLATIVCTRGTLLRGGIEGLTTRKTSWWNSPFYRKSFNYSCINCPPLEIRPIPTILRASTSWNPCPRSRVSYCLSTYHTPKNISVNSFRISSRIFGSCQVQWFVAHRILQRRSLA